MLSGCNLNDLSSAINGRDNTGSFQIQLLFITGLSHVINNLKQRLATLIVVYGKDPDLNANKLLVTEICSSPSPFLLAPCYSIWNADQSSVQLNKFINAENLDGFLFVNLISDNLFRVINASNPVVETVDVLKYCCSNFACSSVFYVICAELFFSFALIYSVSLAVICWNKYDSLKLIFQPVDSRLGSCSYILFLARRVRV